MAEYKSKKSKKESERTASLLEDAKEKFQECEEHYKSNYRDGEEDQEFLYGVSQWDAQDVSKRQTERRPSLVLNQLLPYAHQVINGIKETRPAIRISPVDSKADPDTAEVIQGIIRNIERQSKANIAYDTAAMNSVGAGIGWIRISTDYANPMSFEQEIKIERVLNFQSVYIDPQSQSLDGSDAEYMFIFDDIPLDRFEEMYPDADTAGFEKSNNEWYQDDSVRVAEYFYKECEERTIYKVEAEGKQAVITKEEKEALEEEGVTVNVLDERITEFPVIKYCKLNGSEILEESEWAGKYIPIVPVYGEECWLEGKREFHSLIRQAKDAQRMYNYWKSASTEFIALQPKAPYVGAVGSFKSYPNEWANANNENYTFLEYDVVYDDNGQRVEPPTRQQPITGSPAMMQEAISAREDIRLGLGIYEEAVGDESNAISGIAVRNRQIRGDTSTFHFMDNLTASITQVGCILVDLIPRIYSDRQVVRILGIDNKEEVIPVNQSYITDENTGKPRPLKKGERAEGIYDLTVGQYDVVCDVGASYSSRRQEMADKLQQVISASPELIQVTGDLLFESMDIPLGKEIAKRLRVMMPPETLEDDPMAAKLMKAAQQMEAMNEQILNLEAALQDKRSKEDIDREFEAKKIAIDQQEVIIKAKKTEADIMKILSEINESGQTAELTAQLTGRVDDLTDAVAQILDNVENELATSEPEESVAMLETEE